MGRRRDQILFGWRWEFATIIGTGTEDYFGGSYNWDVDGDYQPYSTPFLGMHQVIRPDGTYQSQHRHAVYRWHVMDPIRFEEDLRVTIQALGLRSGRRYLPGQHDICSVAYWYQSYRQTPSQRYQIEMDWRLSNHDKDPFRERMMAYFTCCSNYQITCLLYLSIIA